MSASTRLSTNGEPMTFPIHNRSPRAMSKGDRLLFTQSANEDARVASYGLVFLKLDGPSTSLLEFATQPALFRKEI